MKREILENLYLEKRMSAKAISLRTKKSESSVNYWLKKHNIKKRNISDALYLAHNPSGDPFVIKRINNKHESFLLGLGLGIYWGEGTKSNKSSVRLGNTDPNLIIKFIEFLERIYGVDRKRLKFGLQVFNSGDATKAGIFWKRVLCVGKDQFYTTIITPSRGGGTYSRKIKHGVLTVYFNNTKLRNIICETIEKL